MANDRNYPSVAENSANIPASVNALRDAISTDIQAIIDGDIPVGVQGSAITDADGTLADLTTKFNLVLANMRTRGEIAS